MLELYEHIIPYYIKSVKILNTDLGVHNIKHEKKMYRPTKVLKAPKLFYGRVSNVDTKDIDKDSPYEAKNIYYLKWKNDLLKVVNNHKNENQKIELIVGNLECAFPLFSVFKLKYEIEKELPYSKRQYFFK